MTLFTARDLLHRARHNLVPPAPIRCGVCGPGHEADEMAAQHYAGDALTDAETHYGPLCTRCFENLHECAHCGNRRRTLDMWSLGDAPTCSMRCDTEFEIERREE